jgi:hypothetical protein
MRRLVLATFFKKDSQTVFDPKASVGRAVGFRAKMVTSRRCKGATNARDGGAKRRYLGDRDAVRLALGIATLVEVVEDIQGERSGVLGS